MAIHEFGHAVDAAYGDLSSSTEWSALQKRLMDELGSNPAWNTYYNHPQELFAESFASWSKGGSALQKLTLGNEELTRELEGYFDREFR